MAVDTKRISHDSKSHIVYVVRRNGVVLGMVEKLRRPVPGRHVNPWTAYEGTGEGRSKVGDFYGGADGGHSDAVNAILYPSTDAIPDAI
jgi:hypothetical protein